MANIEQDLQKILDARYGKDVRQSIHDAIEDMNTQVEGDRAIVKGYADRAESAAEEAEETATNVSQYVTQAQTYATNAGESATNAQSYMQSAESAKTDAETAKDSATEQAGIATTQATNASESATSAQAAKSDAETAKSSAESASDSASESASSALTTKGEVEQLKTDVVGLKSDVEGLKSATETASANASTSETNASTYATNASNSAEEAKEYAEQASQGVPIATTEVVGKVKPDGTTITVDTDGTIHGASTYELPTASADTLGGIKVGQRLSISGGVLSADEQTITVDDEMSATSTNPVQNKVIYAEIDELKNSVSNGKTLVANAITDKGVATESTDSFQTMADNISQIETGGGELHGATISCTTYEETLLGTVATLSLNDEVVQSVTINADGTFSFTDIEVAGTYSIYVTNGTKENTNEVEISAEHIVNKTVVSIEVSFLTIVTWADGSDEKIAKMLEAHYEGKINISDYWSVGDVRNVNLSAMGNSGIANYYGTTETHTAQTVQMVIIDFNHDDLTTSINGKTKAAITIHQKDCMKLESNSTFQYESNADRGNGAMNNYTGSHTNVGGWTSCSRRTWCNNSYKNALPSTLKNAVKTVRKLTSAGGQSSTINTTNDDIFLLSEVEIFGSTTYSYAGEGSQYSYFKQSTSNRYKNPKWSSASQSSATWWERSPYSSNSTRFCIVNTDGSASHYFSGYARGLAPALCL